MADPPFFSVIIPTYNRASLVARSIQSVLHQTFTRFEVIVVDDGSTDDTGDTVRRIVHPAVTYHPQIRSERGAARNTGTRLARGRYINFLDSDDVVYPNHLQAAATFIEEHSEPPVCLFAYDVKDDDRRILRPPTVFSGDLNTQIIDGNPLSCNGVFLRRDIAIEYPFSEDADLAVKTGTYGWRLAARFPLLYSNVPTSTIIDHRSRSVVTMSQGQLIHRITRLLECLLDDDEVRRVYGQHEERMRAHLYCYLALHLALGKSSRHSVIKHLGKAVAARPSIVCTRIFLGALKRLLLIAPTSRNRPAPQPASRTHPPSGHSPDHPVSTKKRSAD